MAEWFPDIVLGILLFALWLALGFAAVAMPPILGVVWVTVLICAFLWLYVVNPVNRGNHRTLHRYGVKWPHQLRPMFQVALPAVFFAGTGASWLIARWAGPGRSDTGSWASADAYASSSLGWLAMALLIVCLAPLVEEFYFRGLIQGSLSERFGKLVAVAVAAMLFGLVHMHPWPWTLQPIFMGLLFGVAVVVTESVWAGVVLHAGWNAQGLIFQAAMPTSFVEPWELTKGWLLLLAAFLVVGVGLYYHWATVLHRKMQHSARGARHTAA